MVTNVLQSKPMEEPWKKMILLLAHAVKNKNETNLIFFVIVIRLPPFKNRLVHRFRTQYSVFFRCPLLKTEDK